MIPSAKTKMKEALIPAKIDGPFSGSNRPRTFGDLVDRLMKYDWGRQLDILEYMKRFQTFDALYADLDKRQNDATVPEYHGKPPRVAIDLAAGVDQTAIVVSQRPKKPRIFGIAGNQIYDGGKFIASAIEYTEIDQRPNIRDVTPPKPKKIEEKR